MAGKRSIPELLTRLKWITATLREATDLSNGVIAHNKALLRGFCSDGDVSPSRKEAMMLNEMAEEVVEESRFLRKRSRELSRRLGLS